MGDAQLVVFEETLSFLAKADISRLGRTCKFLNSLTKREIFHTVQPGRLQSARGFCQGIQGNPALGALVREVKFKFYGEGVLQQTQLELDLREVIPHLTYLLRFRWLLDCKPFQDCMWTLLRLHCHDLHTLDLARVDGLREESEIFHITNLRELRFIAWNSDQEPSLNSCLKVPSNHTTLTRQDDRYPQLSDMLFACPDLEILCLNMTLRQSPSIDKLLCGQWTRLRELTLIISDIQEPTLRTHLVSFLTHHPSLRTLTLRPAFPCLADLPDDSLPELQTFEGALTDTLVVLSPSASGREIKQLPKVVLDNIRDLPALTVGLASKQGSLVVIALHVICGELGQDELQRVCDALAPVRKLKLDAKCSCKSITEVTKSMAVMMDLRLLVIDGSFACGKVPRNFAKMLSKTCPRLQFVEITGLGQRHAYEVNRMRKSNGGV